MRKNWKLIKLLLNFLFVFLFIVYFGIESKNMNINNDTYLFLKMYLDTPQKYLFIMTLFLSITVPTIHIPFLVPEFKVRLKNKVFRYVWRKNIGFALLFSVFILFSFGMVAVFYGYSNVVSILDTSLFFRLFSFILSYMVLYTVIYLKTNKYYLGIAFVSAANFLFLILLISFDYYSIVRSDHDELLLLIFTFYIWFINLSGLMYLYLNMDRKEYIS